MKILVIQLRRIGDILLTTPALTYLRSALPEATIHYFCENMGKELIETHSALNAVIATDKSNLLKDIRRVRAEHYDVVIDFMNNPRSRYLTAFSGAALRVGFQKRWRPFFYNLSVPIPKLPEYVPERKIYLVQNFLSKISAKEPLIETSLPSLALSAVDEAFAADWIIKENLRDQPYMILVPIHRHFLKSAYSSSTRQWRQEGFQNVGLHFIRNKGMKVYLSCGPGEEELLNEVRLGHEREFSILPRTTLRKTAAIFKKSKLIITNDGGSMHLAVSVGTPTVTIYGPSRPIDFNPSLSKWNKPPILHLAVNASHLPCLGCRLKKCPIGLKCMNELTDGTVIEAAEKLLAMGSQAAG